MNLTSGINMGVKLFLDYSCGNVCRRTLCKHCSLNKNLHAVFLSTAYHVYTRGFPVSENS